MITRFLSQNRPHGQVTHKFKLKLTSSSHLRMLILKSNCTKKLHHYSKSFTSLNLVDFSRIPIATFQNYVRPVLDLLEVATQMTRRELCDLWSKLVRYKRRTQEILYKHITKPVHYSRSRLNWTYESTYYQKFRIHSLIFLISHFSSHVSSKCQWLLRKNSVLSPR